MTDVEIACSICWNICAFLWPFWVDFQNRFKLFFPFLDFAFSASRNRSEIRDRKLSSIDAENAHHDHSNIARRRHGIWNKFGTSFLERVGHDLVWTDERVNEMRKSQQRESRSLGKGLTTGNQPDSTISD